MLDEFKAEVQMLQVGKRDEKLIMSNFEGAEKRIAAFFVRLPAKYFVNALIQSFEDVLEKFNQVKSIRDDTEEISKIKKNKES